MTSVGAEARSIGLVESMPGPEAVLPGLRDAAARLASLGVPVPPLEGKLIRPLVAFGLVPAARRGRVDRRFWSGALAVQMAHEASLLHDDIVDGAETRRGRETVAAREGVAAALVRGDHYLTGAYRAAAAVGNAAFLDAFIEAVERTVAGEVEQNRRAGAPLDPATYEDVVSAKSGALFGAAAVLGGTVDGPPRIEERWAVGRALGTLYQMVDDLLDYCPGAAVGKPPLQDYRQRKWTWVLGRTGVVRDFGASPDTVVERLFTPGAGGRAPMEGALDDLRARAGAILERTARLAPGDTVIPAVVDGWIRAATLGVEREVAERAAPVPTLTAV